MSERPEHPHRRDADNGVIPYLERRLSKVQKIAIALATIFTTFSAGAASLYHIDNRYVHSDAYAGDVRETSNRLDKSDLRGLEGQLRTINAQILDIERLPRVTGTELAFLKQLRNDKERLEADIRELRATIQEQARKADAARGR